MPRTTSTIPDDLHLLLEGATEAGVFENKSDAIRSVLREYFEHNEAARFAAVVHWYEQGDEVDLGTAARLGGVSRSEMRTTLREHGLEVEPPAGTASDASEPTDSQEQLDSFGSNE